MSSIELLGNHEVKDSSVSKKREREDNTEPAVDEGATLEMATTPHRPESPKKKMRDGVLCNVVTDETLMISDVLDPSVANTSTIHQDVEMEKGIEETNMDEKSMEVNSTADSQLANVRRMDELKVDEDAPESAVTRDVVASGSSADRNGAPSGTNAADSAVTNVRMTREIRAYDAMLEREIEEDALSNDRDDAPYTSNTVDSGETNTKLRDEVETKGEVPKVQPLEKESSNRASIDQDGESHTGDVETKTGDALTGKVGILQGTSTDTTPTSKTLGDKNDVSQASGTVTKSATSSNGNTGSVRFGSSFLSGFNSFGSAAGRSAFAELIANSSGVSVFDIPTTEEASSNKPTTVAKPEEDENSSDSEEDENEDDDDKTADKERSNSTTTAFAIFQRNENSRNPDFAPVAVKTGEESEVKIVEIRAKLYELTGGTWRERGIGVCGLNVDKDDAKSSRLVMRRERTMNVILNTKLVPLMKVTVADSRIDFPGQNTSGQLCTFALKANTSKDAKMFHAKIVETVKALSEQ